jgi:Periplasmic protein involved in polysaccharide export
MKLRTIQFNVVCIAAGLLMLGSSCVNAKKFAYFNDVADTTMAVMANIPDPIIQKNDLLSISVTSVNPEATEIFNMPNLPVAPTVSLNNGLQQAVGYLVHEDGYIKFPMLGNIRAAGLGKRELEGYISKQLVEKKLLTDPIVNVRFINFRVTVLGEVARPGVINVSGERISILEAIGQAGDLTIYGKRDNVALVREDADGHRMVHRFNLNSAALLQSPYFYLKSNDVIYVEPGKVKLASATRGQQLLPSILSAVSIVVVVISAIIRN